MEEILGINSIGLISLDCSHYKTEIVLRALHARESFDITLYALPWLSRKTRSPIFEHRSPQFKGDTLRNITRKLNLDYTTVTHDTEIPSGLDIYIILSGQLLSGEFLKSKRVINCHAGILPIVRGLDAFKWAIYESMPLGVTLHEINNEIDSGKILSIVRTPILKNDSLAILARRHYDNEIDVLCNFEKHIRHKQNEFSNFGVGEVRKRMPQKTEKHLDNCLPNFINTYIT